MKALSLFSGGLDSMLAIKIIEEQGIEVEAFYVDIGFESNLNKIEFIKKSAEELGVKLHILDIKEDYIQNILFNPKYGYGKAFNPCIDCHANMIRVGLEYMKKIDAKFLISGEVLGQRPMSQKKDGLMKIRKLVDNSFVVRPLSAKLLEPSIPEIEGWIDRQKLYDIYGRERKIQIELAKKFQLKNYETPAGGCLLTEAHFAKKIKSYKENLELGVDEINILKVGRFLKVDNKILIIARNRDENPILKDYKGDKFEKIFPIGFPGPIGLLEKGATEETKNLSANILITYTKVKNGEIKIGNELFNAISFEDKSKIKPFMI